MQIKGYLVIFVVYIYDCFLLYAKISAVMLSLYALFPTGRTHQNAFASKSFDR